MDVKTPAEEVLASIKNCDFLNKIREIKDNPAVQLIVKHQNEPIAKLDSVPEGYRNLTDNEIKLMKRSNNYCDNWGLILVHCENELEVGVDSLDLESDISIPIRNCTFEVSIIVVGVVYYSIVENLSTLNSVYWALETCTSVGYGDILNHFNVKKGTVWFAGFYMLIGASFFLSTVSPCDFSEKGAQQIVDAITALLEHGRDLEQHKNMDQGCNNMMKGCVQMLDVYDDRDKRIIVSACREAQAALTPTKDVGDLAALVASVKALNPKLVAAARLSTERANLLKTGPHRESTEEAIKIVTSNSVGLVSSLKGWVQNKNADAAVSRDFYITEINEACERIIYLVNMRYFLAETFCPGGDFATAVANVLDILESGINGDAFDPITQSELMSEYKKVIEEAKKIAHNCDDPEDAKRLRDRIAKCEKLMNEVEGLAKKLQGNPNDEDLKEKYKQACGELHHEIGELRDDCERVLAKNREKAAIDAMILANKLMEKSKAEDVPGVEQISPKLEKAVNHLDNTAKAVASLTENGPKSKAVIDASDNVKKYTPVLIAAAKQAAKSGNAEDKKHADLVKAEWDRRHKGLVDAMDRATNKPGLAAAALERRLADAMKNARDGAKAGDDDKFNYHKEEVQQILDRLNDVLDKELEANHDNAAYTQELQAAKNAIAKESPGYFKSLDQYKADPSESNSKDLAAKENALKAAANRAINALGAAREAEAKRLADAAAAAEAARLAEEARLAAEEAERQARLREEERRRKEAEQAQILEEQRRVVMAAAPKLDTADNAMGKAAQDLHNAVLQWDDTENDLIMFMKRITENFAKMSSLKDQRGAKSELIALSREITADAKKAAKCARLFEQKCPDKRLASNLKNSTDTIETIAQQLKVVTMVKASMPNDNSADEQMTVCAQNLMNNCKDVVSCAHSCFIKSPKDCFPDTKWRKMVYRG
eukprot:Pgem_evm1s16332